MNNPLYYNAAFIAYYEYAMPLSGTPQVLGQVLIGATTFAHLVDGLIAFDPAEDDQRADLLQSICDAYISGKIPGGNPAIINTTFQLAAPSLNPGGGGGGGGGNSNVFTYDQGSPDVASKNFYGNWANLIAAIQGVQSPQIWYTNKNQSVPAGVWEMNRATILCDTFIENPEPFILACDDGTTLNNLYAVGNGGIVEFQNTVVDGLTWDASFGNIPTLLLYGLGATVQKVPGTVDPVHVLAAGFFVAVLLYGAGFQGSGEAVVNLDAGAFMYCFTELRPGLPDNWCEGSGDLVYAAGPDFITPNLASFTGIQFAQSARLTTIDGGTTTPGHSFVADLTTGLYRDGTNGFIGLSHQGNLAFEAALIPGQGSIWVYNQSNGGLRIRDDIGAEVVAAFTGQAWAFTNLHSVDLEAVVLRVSSQTSGNLWPADGSFQFSQFGGAFFSQNGDGSSEWCLFAASNVGLGPGVKQLFFGQDASGANPCDVANFFAQQSLFFANAAGAVVQMRADGSIQFTSTGVSAVIECGNPIVGDIHTPSPYGVHGLTTIAGTGVIRTLSGSEYSRDTIQNTGAGANTFQLPTPGVDVSESYEKYMWNAGPLASTLVVGDTAGHTAAVPLAAGMGARFLFLSTGPVQLTAAFLVA